MSPGSSKQRSGRWERPDDAAERDAATPETPSTDMQPEDAGTAESGNSGRGNAAESGKKQTSKTGQETGSKR